MKMSDEIRREIMETQSKYEATTENAIMDTKAAFKAKVAAVENRKKEEAESARIKERDTDWSEALPVHIADHVMPVAVEMNAEYDRKNRADMDEAAQRGMDITDDKDAVGIMARDILNDLNKPFPSIKIPEIRSIMEVFGQDIELLIHDLNDDIAGIR